MCTKRIASRASSVPASILTHSIDDKRSGVRHPRLPRRSRLAVAALACMLAAGWLGRPLLDVARAQLAGGTSTLRVHRIDSFDGTQQLGHVVVIGSDDLVHFGETWVARREYWFWSGSPAMPAEGWSLTQVASDPAALTTLDLHPQDVDDIYPVYHFANYQTYDDFLGCVTWFELSCEPPGGGPSDDYGYFCQGSGTDQRWYAYLVAGPRIFVPVGGVLRWTPASEPGQIAGAAIIGAPALDCAEDWDGDGVLDCDDNCPIGFNPRQEDVDGDGIGDFCDGCWEGDCDDLSTPCATGICISSECEAVPTVEGGPCDDELFCTSLDICTSGSCV